MKRKMLTTVGALGVCLFVSACGRDVSGTEQSVQSTDIVQEAEEQQPGAQETDAAEGGELTEQDKIWMEFLDDLYVHGDIAIPTGEDSKSFMEQVEEKLTRKPDWENNTYFEQGDGTALMYNAYDSFQSYTVRSTPYNENSSYYNYDYTLLGFDETGKMTEMRTVITAFNEGKRYTNDSIGGFDSFLDTYDIAAQSDLLQVLGLWNEDIEKAFQGETTDDYVEYFDTFYGRVRVAVRTVLLSMEKGNLQTTTALSFAADSPSRFQTIYLSGESGYDDNFQSGITLDAYVMTDEYRACVGAEHKEVSEADADEVWQFLADMKGQSFATCNPWGASWQDFKEVLENTLNITLENEVYIPVGEKWKIRFMEEFMGYFPLTNKPAPTGTEFTISNGYVTLTAKFDYDSDQFTGYVLTTENPCYFSLVDGEDVEKMGDFLKFGSEYAVSSAEDVLTVLGLGGDLEDGTTTVQTPYGEASLAVTKNAVGDYSEINHKIRELGEFNLQMEIEALGGATADGTSLEGQYADAELFELMGYSEKDYITVAEPMTEHDSIIAVLTFPEDGNAPVGRIQILAQDAEGLDGLQYGNWEFSVYANE